MNLMHIAVFITYELYVHLIGYRLHNIDFDLKHSPRARGHLAKTPTLISYREPVVGHDEHFLTAVRLHLGLPDILNQYDLFAQGRKLDCF